MSFLPPKKTITVDVLPDGTVEIEASGFTGPDCLKATEALRKALGTTTETVKKPEFHQPAVTTETVKKKVQY